MRTAEAKLAEWHQLYRELAQAQSQLVEAVLAPGEAADRLRDRIARLQIECEKALQALDAAVAESKKKRQTPAILPVPRG